MRGIRFNLSQWGLREWALTVVAFIAFIVMALTAGRGLALGSVGEVMGIRFGGDAQRTRVVVDLDRSTRGEIATDGAGGQLIFSLSDVTPDVMLSGGGSGLVRSYRATGAGANTRVSLDLASGVEVERRFLLPPGDGIDHYRYVIDLKSSGPALPAVVRAPAPGPREKPLIFIDAGHGGRDPGAHGAETQEKTVTLAAAQALKAELDRSGRYRVRLTREGDAYVDLNRRVAIARQAGADLFISLHADAGADPATRGASVYTLSEQGAGRAVREFTRSQNWHRSLNLPGRDASVDRILLDMTQRTTQNRSAMLARSLLGRIDDADHPLLRRSHRDAGLAVLLAPDVPAVLLEMGFITNADDERLLTDNRARRRLMRAVAEGIDRYFEAPSAPVQMASASADAEH